MFRSRLSLGLIALVALMALQVTSVYAQDGERAAGGMNALQQGQNGVRPPVNNMPANLNETDRAMEQTTPQGEGVPAITLTPFVPELSVPIPGVEFTQPTVENGVVSVPFLAQYINGVYRYFLGVITLIAIIMVVYGGFHYLVGATTGSVMKGKQLITDAIMGLALAFCSYFILYTINPKLVNLQPLRLSNIQSVAVSTDSFADSLARDQEAGEVSVTPGQGPRSLCRQNLTPRPHHRTSIAWCSGCAAGCQEIHTGRPDQACLALLTCGGGFGQFLDALTDDCYGKTFGWLEGLDGGTFGILHYTENQVTGLLERLRQKDPAAYARVIAAGGGVEVSNAALCASNQNDRGFICNPGYRRLIDAALQERSFTLIQLEDAVQRYNRIRGIAQGFGFRSAYGQAMIATMLNNPGACGGSLTPLRQRCTQSNESEKIDCFLREFVAVPCRGNAAGAQSRVASIRRNLDNIASRSEPPVIKTLEELEACVRR